MRLLFAAFLTLSTLVSHMAFAQGGFENRSRPGDTYQFSCQIVRESYRYIEAHCRDRHGRTVFNQFDRSQCVGPVANNNGFLTCETSESGWGLPGGSYQHSCTSCYTRGPILDCSCRDIRGNIRPSTLDLRYCRGPVSNANGNLVCD